MTTYRSTTKTGKRISRHRKIRMRISGTAAIPRLAVYRSNKHVYAQLIDDAAGKTLVSAHDFDIKGKSPKAEKSKQVGTLLAERAVAAKIKKVVFDRGGFLYAGRVKMLADAARAGGLEF